MKARITGLGKYNPEKVVTNADLSKLMDTSDEWIVERTGIHERRFFNPEKDTTSKMGARAAEEAMKQAGIKASDVDMILFATLSPDYYFPGSGVLLGKELGIPGVPALDIRQQCGGFVYGLSVAQAYIESGMYKNLLLVGSEVQTTMMELSDRGRNVACIFGDGAGAAVLQPDSEKGILSTKVYSDGSFAEDLMVELPSSHRTPRFSEEMIDSGALLPVMNGRMVFKHATTRFPEVINEVLELNNKTTEDLNLLIPHQANLRISQAVQKRLNLRDDQVFNNIQKYGNTTAASIPIAFTEAFAEGKVNKGDLVCLAAFGSGFVWGATLLEL